MSSSPVPQLDPAARPAVAVASVPALLAAVARRPRTAASLALLPLATSLFFRDPVRSPDRDPVADPDLVVAPADGVVMHAGPGRPGVAPPGEWQQVSIFLSVLDVHVNRSPWHGTVQEVTYTPGRWLAAYRHESAHLNERSEVVLADDTGRTVVFRQVVGLLARRVVTRVRPGEPVATGQRIGVMKLGSRMDVFVPPAAHLLVGEGERTVGGETPLARWPR